MVNPAEFLESYFVFMECGNFDLQKFNGAVLAIDAFITPKSIETPAFDQTRKLIDGASFAMQKDDALYLAKITRIDRFSISEDSAQEAIEALNQDESFSGLDSFFRFESGVVQPFYDFEANVAIVGHSSKTDGLALVSPSPIESARKLARAFARKNKDCRFSKRTINSVLPMVNKKMYEVTGPFNAICSHIVCSKLQWSCRISIGRVTVVVYCDPTAVRELWKLRDLPAGASRRAALLHWVSDHWRKHRHDPDTEGYVRKHLRGQNECAQGDMRIEVIPGLVTAQTIEQAKVERRDMRKDLRDRRKRLQRVMA